jgi:hypothetical protein
MPNGSEVLRVFPFEFILLGLACLLVAALTPVSPRKGWARLFASLLVGTAFVLGSCWQMVKDNRTAPGAIELGVGLFLVYVGVRKFKRDPEGKTPVASIQ